MIELASFAQGVKHIVDAVEGRRAKMVAAFL
jgi:hypothetical protein